MPEPTVQSGDHSIVISPDNSGQRRTWPDPTSASDLAGLAAIAPQRLTREEIQQLSRIASSYCYIFELPSAAFLPTHLAIRAHLAQEGER